MQRSTHGDFGTSSEATTSFIARQLLANDENTDRNGVNVLKLNK